ncbi:Tudor domain-containing protein 7 [Mortierella sp. 14UC]|nr:Tudor domain-containing protein 7 [Mortierella sp. 14UC]
MPALPTSPAPCLAHSLQNEDWPIEAQKVNDEQVQAFCREYAKTAPEKGSPIKPDDHIRRVKTALAEYTTRGLLGGKPLPEEFLRQGSEHILSPSPEELMELYATLLRDNLDLNPKMREVLTDQTFATATMTLHGDQIDQHFRQHHQNAPPQQRAPCGCGVDHGDEDALDFPEDSYEDEPDEEDDEDEDDDERDEDEDEEEDSMDDDEYEEDDEQDVVDGYSHHYDDVNLKRMAYEEEKLKLETVRRVREEERRLKEEFRKKKLSERHKQKQEKDRIELLQRLRREDEERRKREALEKQRREKLELEMRRKREAAEADQNARSFLFQCTMLSQIETVKQMIGATPDDSCLLTGLPRFSTTAATRLFGWEFMTMVEGVGEVSEERGVQETLLHVAVRVGCTDLATFFIDKGAPLDALDAEGLTPLHTAAKHTSPFEVCKLLVEKTAHHIDRTCIVAGKTALHYAAQNGNAELVALLLQHHARINPVDLKGNTPELLAKTGLESALSEKPSKANTKQANTAKAQKYRSTMQHLQKAIAAVKEAQSRKDAQLEEQRRKEEALAREEAEKDNAARRKQEEKLEADVRRRLEEEKELERLKAMTSDPNGNNNNSNKKKKKKKGKGGNDNTPVSKEISHSTQATSKVEHSSESAASSPALPSINIKAIQDPVSNQSPKTTTRPAASTVSSEATTKGPVSAGTTAPAKPAPVPSAVTRIPKPKTSYRPSQLVVTRMTDMGFPLRESRKALIQTEGRVEDAIDLLTSGAQLADDSEDEAEQAAERAKAKQRLNVANAANAVKAPAQVRPQDAYVNGHHPAVRPVQQQQQPPQQPPQHAAGHLPHQQHPHPNMSHLQQPQQQQPIHHSPAQPMAYQRTHNGPPGMFPVQQRPVNHPVQILQRTHPMAPHVQSRSVPTQVLQRPPPHVQNGQPAMNVQNQATRRSFSNQGVPPMSSPVAHPATTLASFIAPRTGQPAPPTRAPYSYGPAASSSVHNKSQTTPLINTSQLHQNSAYKIPGSTSASVLDRSTPGRVSAGDIGLARKFGSMDLSEHQGYGSSSGFSSFPTATSTWDMNLNNNKGATPTSLELPAPISVGYQQSSMGGHNLWATPGLSLPGPPMLQSVGDSSSISSFGSPFLTSLPATHHSQHQQQHSQQHSHHQHPLGQHQQQHLPRSPTAGSSLGGLQGYGLSDMDLGNADGEMIKDVLAMTGAIDSEEFAKFEAEYSLLDSGFSTGGNNNSGSTAPSRAVGGGRGSNSGASGQTASSLWGNSGNDTNHHGLPSPIGTVNGHARRGLDGFDSHGSNGVSDSKGGVSEYSQWNSGFALEQTMYPTTSRQQGPTSSSSFVDSFFGSQARTGSSPYNQHAQLSQQPLSPFDYSPFGSLGGSSGGGAGGAVGSHTSPALSSSSLSNVIGSNSNNHGSRGGSASQATGPPPGIAATSSSLSSAVKKESGGPNSPKN